jgi:CelD/BcsL family acetyltransferase involved in cellulose biosynthesis
MGVAEPRAQSPPQVRLLEGFEALQAHEAQWRAALDGRWAAPFLAPGWQQEWWQAFGGERLLIAAALREGRLHALAPMFELEQMLFLVGSGGSDYLDVVGSPDERELAAMLDAARVEIEGFAGIRFYHLPESSPTVSLLPGVAARLGLELHREETSAGRWADLHDPEQVTRLLDRRSVRKEDARMRRDGPLAVRVAAPPQLDSWLASFFAMHHARWSSQPGGDAIDANGEEFLRHVARRGVAEGWLRMTMLEWRDAPAAFDIGLIHGERRLSYLVARDQTIRDHSPGRVLIRALATAALEDGARVLDFGLGEEDYKVRNAAEAAPVANWSLYPPEEGG